jgi:hypothetical protein
VSERVGEDEQADGQTGGPDRVEGGRQRGDVEGEVSDGAGDHQAVARAQQLGGRADPLAQVLARLRECRADPPGRRAVDRPL